MLICRARAVEYQVGKKRGDGTNKEVVYRYAACATTVRDEPKDMMSLDIGGKAACSSGLD